MKIKFKTQFNEAKNLLAAAERIVIIPHHNPDGDAIGSALALFNILNNAGKNAQVVSPNSYPDFLRWLPGSNQVLIHDDHQEEAAKVIANADLLILTDFNCLDRVEPLDANIKAAKAHKILIDHHPEPENFADIIISETTVCSTAELALHFIHGIAYSAYLDKATASCLMTGILTDTGAFSYNSSNPSTFEAVADLLRTGIDKNQIYANIFDNYAESRMNLLGYCLNEKMIIYPEYNTGIISLTQEELDRFNYQPGDTEGFVNYPLSVKGVIFSAIFIEKDEYIKISFRSKGSFPANKFSANHFNGGGHVNAAGGNSQVNMKESLEKFAALLPQYKDALCANE